MTNTTNKNNMTSTTEFNFKKYIPAILGIRKNTLKLPIGRTDELEKFVQNILDIELDDLQPVLSDSRNYSGLYFAEVGSKVYKIYCHITKQEFLSRK